MNGVIILGSHFPSVVGDVVDSATKTIDIIAYEWRIYATRPDHVVSVFNEKIFSAVKRGVRVRAIVANASVADYLRHRGVSVRLFESSKLLHAKVLLVDENRAVVGSHNLTQSAFLSNVEVSALVCGKDELVPLLTFFGQLYGF